MNKAYLIDVAGLNETLDALELADKLLADLLEEKTRDNVALMARVAELEVEVAALRSPAPIANLIRGGQHVG